MAYKILLPKFGMAMEAAKIIEWKKEVGDPVGMEEAVLVVENEKLTTEIKSMQAGILLQKVAAVGESYGVGDLLAWLGAEGEKIEDAAVAAPGGGAAAGAASTVGAPASAPAALRASGEGKRVAISPLAKKLAAQLGVDYTRIQGTGPGGRIDKDDVRQYADAMAQGGQGGAGATAAATAASAPAAAATAAARPHSATTTAASPLPLPMSSPQAIAGTVMPYKGMRKAVGEKMLYSWTHIPMVTHHVKADVGALLDIRAQLNEGVEEKNLRFSVNDLLLKLTAAALAQAPALNATFEEDGIHIHQPVNLGMAVALDDGLIVPVIHSAESKSLSEISREAKALAALARSGRLSLDNVIGGTFTVSNLGGYQSVDFFNPIINPPEAAILGIGRIAETVVPLGGEVAIRPMIGLSLTYDHRAIDGAVAAAFMKGYLDLLAKPLPALLR